MAKYSKKTANKIIRLFEEDSYTATEVCSITNITQQAYYSWLKNRPEFKEAVEEAKNKFLESYAHEAKKSLMKLIKGYSVNESRTTTVPSVDDDGNVSPVIKEQTVTKKEIQPNPAAIFFALTNRDGKHWKNRQYNEVTGKDGKDLLEPITIEVIDKTEQVEAADDKSI